MHKLKRDPHIHCLGSLTSCSLVWRNHFYFHTTALPFIRTPKKTKITVSRENLKARANAFQIF